MKYSTEDVSPIAKKVTVDMSAEEVNASITATVTLYMDNNSVSVPGFRKGHVPMSIVESRFQKHIYAEAREDLVNVQINKLSEEVGFKPVNKFTVTDVSEFARNKDFRFVVECEVFPTFELPTYEGLSVTVKKEQPLPNYIDMAIDRMRKDNAQLVPIDGEGPAVDGQVVNLDFSLLKANGQVLKGQSVQNRDFIVLPQAFVPDFYNFLKTLPLGKKGEHKVTFPKNFLNKEMAGRTYTLRLQVNAIKNVVLPEVNDAFAAKLGYGTVDVMKERLLAAEKENLENLTRTKAENEILNQMLKICDFPVPSYYVTIIQNSLYSDYKERMDKAGQAIPNEQETYNLFAKRALESARVFVLLVAIARKEGLNVPEKDVEVLINEEARSRGEDPRALHDYYERTNLIFYLRDRMLADKAMDLVYARSNVTIEEPEGPAVVFTEDEEKAQEKAEGAEQKDAAASEVAQEKTEKADDSAAN